MLFYRGLLLGLFVECEHIDHHLGMFSCFLLGDAILVKQSLPFFWQALYFRLATPHSKGQPTSRGTGYAGLAIGQSANEPKLVEPGTHRGGSIDSTDRSTDRLPHPTRPDQIGHEKAVTYRELAGRTVVANMSDVDRVLGR